MLLIKGGRLIDPENKTELQRDLLIENGVIKAIGENIPDDGCERVIDAGGLAVAPGLIDVHVHFREPGFTYKEDIASGAKAAARGGFTTVVCMANTKPVLDNADTLRDVLQSAKKTDINVLTLAAVSKGLGGEELTDMKGLLELGAIGFSDDGAPITDAGFLYKAMRMAAELGVPISLHEEDPGLIGHAGINEGPVSGELGIRGASSVSESSMVARDCMLAYDARANVHIQHVSSAQTVVALRFAKSLGVKITAEITPQHFSLTQDSVRTKGSLAKLNPPLRAESDRQSLIAGLQDGSIDIIATDHAPHSGEEKSKPLTDAPSGMIGLETALALGITNLVRPGHLTLSRLIEKMTINPAKLYNLRQGCIRVGERADVVIFDEAESWVVSDFASRSSNSPFIGEELFGKVKYTICGGKIVYQDNPAKFRGVRNRKSN